MRDRIPILGTRKPPTRNPPRAAQRLRHHDLHPDDAGVRRRQRGRAALPPVVSASLQRAPGASLRRSGAHVHGPQSGLRALRHRVPQIQHVLDVTLAMARLMHGYEKSRERDAETLGPSLFVAGALGALFHDFGYLRRHGDHRHKYGAEYTITHVSRSAAFLRQYMRKLGFADDLARLAATLQHFTGYERKAQSIRVGQGLPRLVGQMLGTADIIAQMADRCYLEKCRDRLYPEFVLGALGAPKKAPKLPAFASGDELVAKTPTFYEGATRRLNDDLGHAY